MKKDKLMFSALLLFAVFTSGNSQTVSTSALGTANDFINEFKATKDGSNQPMLLQLSPTKEIDVRLTDDQSEGEKIIMYGQVQGTKSSVFFISGTKNNLSGQIIIDFNEAYEISTDLSSNRISINATDINKFICVTPGSSAISTDVGSYQLPRETATQAAYSSLPGATVVVYLDFDGEYVNDSYWNSQMGGARQCTGPNYSASMVKQIWATISEDYRPFNINITTDRAVYDATPSANREMVIYTNTWNPNGSTGGISSVGGFASNSTHICWVFFDHLVNNVNDQSETGSHESGHTWGLLHDSNTSTVYYAGQGNWGPIMGNNYQSAARSVWQWSKGEYQNARQDGTSKANTQDDVDIIQKNPNVGYRTDEDANTMASARGLIQESNATVLGSKNNGIITTRIDKDYFKFTTPAGNVTFKFQSGTNDFSNEPDLDIQVRLLDANGTEIAKHDSVVGMAARISKSVPAGTYYLEIDGVGYLDPVTTGYSDYASIGYYEISGSYPLITTGISGQEQEMNTFSLYPNPANDKLYVTVPDPSAQTYSIKIIDALGRTISMLSHFQSQNGIDISDLAPGVYMLQLSDEQTKATAIKKFIKE